MQHTKTIFVAESDAVVLALLCHILTREGYKVQPVEQREELLRIIRDAHFDALIADAMLDGVVDTVASVPHRAPRIILTTPHNELPKLANHATLRKPIEFGLLLDTVRDCVTQSE